MDAEDDDADTNRVVAFLSGGTCVELEQNDAWATAERVAELDARRPGRLMLVGDPGVGKTTAIAVLCHPEFDYDRWVVSPNCKPTIGADMATVKARFADGHVMTVNIFDTAGSERFAMLVTPVLVRKADAVIVMFSCDVTDDNETEAHIRAWTKLVRDLTRGSLAEDQPLFLVASKADLMLSHPRSLNAIGRATALAKELGYENGGCRIISAVTKDGILPLMRDVAGAIRRKRDAMVAEEDRLTKSCSQAFHSEYSAVIRLPPILPPDPQAATCVTSQHCPC